MHGLMLGQGTKGVVGNEFFTNEPIIDGWREIMVGNADHVGCGKAEWTKDDD